MRVKRGEVWYIEKGYSVGSEQRSGRPAIIVSNDKNNTYSTTVEVVYLTTKPKQDLPTHVTIRSLNQISTALCEQITTVSMERLGNYCGTLTDLEIDELDAAIKISLGLPAASEGFSPPPCLHRISLKSKPAVPCFSRCAAQS